jgi:hypothetical protein
MRNLRDVARYGLFRACMLRRDDTKGDKLRAGCYKSRADFAGSLLVEPGKAHTQEIWAEVPGLAAGAEPKGDWSDWVTAPGYAMDQWLRCLRHLHGGTIPPMAALFPALEDDGTLGSKAADADVFKEMLRVRVRAAGFPASFADRITLHGFRSGGCSDAVNSGRCTVQEIMRQGRWTSHCFEMYIHMHADLVRNTFREVACDAALSLSERTAKADEERRKGEGRMMARWQKEFVTSCKS